MDTTDEKVLQNLAVSLSRLVQGGHARVTEVKTQLKKLSVSLRDRLMDLLPGKSTQNKGRKSSSPKRRSAQKSDASQSSSDLLSEASSEAVETEHSLCLCLMRLRILTKRCHAELLFGEDEEVEGFCNAVGEAIAKRLQDRKTIFNDDEATERDGQASTVVPEIWTKGDPNVHAVVAHAIDEGLNLLLGVTVWCLYDTLNKPSRGSIRDDSSGASDTEMHDADDERSVLVLRLRDRLVKLLAMCFDQRLQEGEDIIYSDEHHQFSSLVQSSAGRVSSDVRVLFPREWSQAKDPVRRSLALTDDTQLLGGFAEYLHSRCSEVSLGFAVPTIVAYIAFCVVSDPNLAFARVQLHELADSKKTTEANEEKLVHELILPLARSLTANWNDGNRREAGLALAHIAGSGDLASHAIQSMARLLKKVRAFRVRVAFFFLFSFHFRF